MNEIKVLAVDDEPDLLDLLVKRLNRKGFKATGVSSAEEALPLLKRDVYDVAIYDIRMEKMDGLELLTKTKHIQPEIEVIMLTGHGTIDTAIDAMKRGAYDYLTKPYQLKELEAIIYKADEKKSLIVQNKGMKQLIQLQDRQFTIVGESEHLKKVIELTRRVADSDIPIAIEGESGTGKELFAKALHYWSERREQPFVAINSGAIAEQLLESELFGHVKGAFTGAQQEKKGLVEVADGGTLFLDELGEMPLSVQVKLLRFLETGEFRRVGDVKVRNVKVRVVTATNRNMEEEVKNERFREDLYYRLHVVKLEVPPLRKRLKDIPLLVDYYSKQKKQWHGKHLSEKALQALMSYDFPGNVRELVHILERGFLLSKGSIVEVEDLLLPNVEVTHEQPELLTTLEDIEKAHILSVLNSVDWNKTDAANILGISVRNIYRKIEQYELKRE